MKQSRFTEAQIIGILKEQESRSRKKPSRDTMEEAEWMWAVLDRMEQDAKPRGWADMIDQIKVTRRVLAAETGRMLDPAPGNVVRVDFNLRRQIHLLDASSF